MARQSFRGAGGAGAVVVPRYSLDARPYEATALSRSAMSDGVIADGDRRLEGVLAIVASGVLVVVGLLVAGWALAG
jgi:hypothetical protein